MFVTTIGGLIAFDLATGTEQWTFAPGDQPWIRPPTVTNGTVYVGMEDENGL